ncbi:MAG TPA: hypothetical protein VK364_13135 [Hymenobacter sp.]|jgi:hypothetical protein|nr:hypothetical protein [Hymenobacter sp.]HLL97286.1 hypothetical protein [Spirosoma sp.]
MITARHSELIVLPLTEVYGVMACYYYDGFWRKTVQRSEQDTPGLAQSGRRLRQVIQLLGQEMSIEAEVTAAALNRRVAYESVGGPLALWDQRTFERIDKTTRVTFELSVDLKGWQRLMAPLLVHQLEQFVRAELLAAKTLLENTPNVLVDLSQRVLTSPSTF